MTKPVLCSQPFEKSIIVFHIIQAFLGYSPVWWVRVISAGAFPWEFHFLILSPALFLDRKVEQTLISSSEKGADQS